MNRPPTARTSMKALVAANRSNLLLGEPGPPLALKWLRPWKRCLVYVTPNKKLMMHRLLQEMGRSIVDRESTLPAKRSRVWCNTKSVEMLMKGKGSETTKGPTLDINMLMEDDDEFKLFDESERLNFMKVLPSLKILNLENSQFLKTILYISRLPNLETLILWTCDGLVHICETIGKLTSLALLNMTGCENLQFSFSFPRSLEHLVLKDCNLEYTNDFVPLSFSDQSFLQYLNLSNSIFELLPSYNHLKSLRVLDLSLCSRLQFLLCLPSTLAELYIYYCTSLEKVAFESHRFTLQEFGYKGCSILTEIEGFIKLVPPTKLNEADLGHMKWLKEYQNHELYLAGNDELMEGRSCNLQTTICGEVFRVMMPSSMWLLCLNLDGELSSSIWFCVISFGLN